MTTTKLFVDTRRDIDLHRRKRNVLYDLFKALLHKLTTGDIQVGELDPSEIGQGVDVDNTMGRSGRIQMDADKS